MKAAGGRVTYCRVTSALQSQTIRRLRSRREQWTERESTPKKTNCRGGMWNFHLPSKISWGKAWRRDATLSKLRNRSRMQGTRPARAGRVPCKNNSSSCLGSTEDIKTESDLLFALLHTGTDYSFSCSNWFSWGRVWFQLLSMTTVSLNIFPLSCLYVYSLMDLYRLFTIGLIQWDKARIIDQGSSKSQCHSRGIQSR